MWFSLRMERSAYIIGQSELFVCKAEPLSVHSAWSYSEGFLCRPLRSVKSVNVGCMNDGALLSKR